MILDDLILSALTRVEERLSDLERILGAQHDQREAIASAQIRAGFVAGALGAGVVLMARAVVLWWVS
jgi:hypothetical protein